MLRVTPVFGANESLVKTLRGLLLVCKNTVNVSGFAVGAIELGMRVSNKKRREFVIET